MKGKKFKDNRKYAELVQSILNNWQCYTSDCDESDSTTSSSESSAAQCSAQPACRQSLSHEPAASISVIANSRILIGKQHTRKRELIPQSVAPQQQHFRNSPHLNSIRPESKPTSNIRHQWVPQSFKRFKPILPPVTCLKAIPEVAMQIKPTPQSPARLETIQQSTIQLRPIPPNIAPLKPIPEVGIQLEALPHSSIQLKPMPPIIGPLQCIPESSKSQRATLQSNTPINSITKSFMQSKPIQPSTTRLKSSGKSTQLPPLVRNTTRLKPLPARSTHLKSEPKKALSSKPARKSPKLVDCLEWSLFSGQRQPSTIQIFVNPISTNKMSFAHLSPSPQVAHEMWLSRLKQSWMPPRDRYASLRTVKTVN